MYSLKLGQDITTYPMMTHESDKTAKTDNRFSQFSPSKSRAKTRK